MGCYLIRAKYVSNFNLLIMSHMVKLCCTTCTVYIESHSVSMTCNTQILVLK